MIILEHVSQNGTGITNFDKSELPRYRAAIRAYNGPARLEISPCPFSGERGFYSVDLFSSCCSLHRLNKVDLSDFWELFRDLTRNPTEAK